MVAVSACSYDAPSQLDGAARVEVFQTQEAQSYVTGDLNERALKSIAREMTTHSDSAVEVTVSYDPKSKSNTAMNATIEAGRIASSLRDNGVTMVETKVLPVANSWKTSRTFLTYTSVSAQAPSDCENLPGYDDPSDVGNSKQHQGYTYGCTVEAMIARQVAHPADLLGRDDNTKTDDARRAENVVWGRGYYGADQYPVLKGESSSE